MSAKAVFLLSACSTLVLLDCKYNLSTFLVLNVPPSQLAVDGK